MGFDSFYCKLLEAEVTLELDEQDDEEEQELAEEDDDDEDKAGKNAMIEVRGESAD